MHPLTWAGLLLIAIGATLVLLPFLGKYLELARVPCWVLYVYRSDGFYFVTSPILILLFVLSAIFYLLAR